MEILWICLAVLAGLCLIIAFLVFPSLRRHKDRRLMDGKAVAHRGLHDIGQGVPENSLAAFERACEAGLMIENDVHLTLDGHVAVFHDDTLDRMCGVPGKPEEKTMEELKTLRLAGTGETIPTLEECLETVKGRVPILIEFKLCGSNANALCEAAEKILKDYKGDYVIQSFYPGVLMWYKKNRPERMRGQLSTVIKGEGIAKRLLGTLISNVVTRPDFISYDHTHARYFFRRMTRIFGAHQAGWTFRSPEELEKNGKYFRTFIFENVSPETVEKYLNERFGNERS